MARDLDELVRDFRERPLDAGPYTFVAADALTMKVREGGRVIKIAVMVATGVNADGFREILGVATSTARVRGRLEHLLQGPRRPRPVRGRAGHLRRAHRPGRRDRGEPARRVLATVPHPLHRQPDVRVSQARLGRGQGDAALRVRPDRRRRRARPVRQAPRPRRRALPEVHAHLDAAREEILAFTAFPKRPVAPDLVEQPQRTAQPRDPPPHRRRRDLPRPRPRSSASSAPSWPSSTTNGPTAAATSDSTSSPEPTRPDHHRAHRGGTPARRRDQRLTRQRRITRRRTPLHGTCQPSCEQHRVTGRCHGRNLWRLRALGEPGPELGTPQGHEGLGSRAEQHPTGP